MKKILPAILLTLFAANLLQAQDSANVRKGWTFGVLPSFSYDADLGLQLGGLTNIYYFGDGAIYPEYYHSFYAEAATSSRHYGLFRVSYDSKYLIPGHRLSVDLTYMPDKMCDFLGFNGYATQYNPALTDPSDPAYISRAYYKMNRDMFRFSADLQGTISKPWYWNAGVGLLHYAIGTVDIDRLNKYAKDAADQLPDTLSLYDSYVAMGAISTAESEGGFSPYLHGGITFDTRDRQQNPRRGVHADAFLTYYAGVGNLKDYNNLMLNASWRQYITLVPKRLTFAYRLGTQLNLAGQSPFYLYNYLNQLYMQRCIYEGLGGGNSLRGIMRNRICAPGIAFANIELRTQVAQFSIGKEHFYIGLNPFLDAGCVVQPFEHRADLTTSWPDEVVAESGASTYKPHLSAGCGLKIAMNDNFVLSVDWATALNEQDNGKFSNLYIKMGYMF